MSCTDNTTDTDREVLAAREVLALAAETLHLRQKNAALQSQLAFARFGAAFTELLSDGDALDRVGDAPNREGARAHA